MSQPHSCIESIRYASARGLIRCLAHFAEDFVRSATRQMNDTDCIQALLLSPVAEILANFVQNNLVPVHLLPRYLQDKRRSQHSWTEAAAETISSQEDDVPAVLAGAT